jgi:hypothetical protein
MREIKFRGLDLMTGEWVFGSYLKTEKGHYILSQDAVFTDGLPSYKVDGETVGQFIGLKGSTVTDEFPEGIEVYESDILYDPIANNFFIVTWDDNYANFFLKNVSEDLDKPDYDFAEFDVDVCNSLYVVGNIHKNPELLEDSDGGLITCYESGTL